ncbi:biotin--[acetyl-CoA-carboxylase] ligase [Blastochloris tepida]|uniref:biotin--[biotin carboxyl-carrier protein] ligase n=1 Tax=Blastochloris tepida TaxID=2233851 RepID=A0A348FY58_9HYPH|nr:biotin--[acetyl-CoA-carboxylase] ligase [Blastochloris tepida]BBF92241.1 biotin--[acetyl-CoA-carboxylase] ligase [Blastochloris tepida]
MGVGEFAGGSTPVIALDDVGSTNAEALARARQGGFGPVWITAARQTAGRGRRGRAWASEPGNLYASILLTDPAPSEACPQLCFVAGLALFDAVGAVCRLDMPRLSLKWPNDLMLDGAKCAGILVEGEVAPAGHPLAVVIGFGVNCAHHPQGTSYPATHLSAAGCKVTPALLLSALDAALAVRLAEWRGGDGFSAIRANWLARAGTLGQPITVRTGAEVVDGRFETLDGDGALVLLRGDGTRTRIGTGEILPIAGIEEARA